MTPLPSGVARSEQFAGSALATRAGGRAEQGAPQPAHASPGVSAPALRKSEKEPQPNLLFGALGKQVLSGEDWHHPAPGWPCDVHQSAPSYSWQSKP